MQNHGTLDKKRKAMAIWRKKEITASNFLSYLLKNNVFLITKCYRYGFNIK